MKIINNNNIIDEDNNINYVEYIAEKVDNSIKYSEYLSEQITDVWITEEERLAREKSELRMKKLKRIIADD